MIIVPHTLSIITTHKCTAACDHCCFNCSPQVPHQMTAARIHGYIDQATEIPSIQAIVFTGGECFLLGKELDALVRRSSNHGFGTRFVSNGYWATSREIARKRLSRLVDNGLLEANFSTGDAHSRYVPPEYVRNGAIEAAAAGLTTVIMVELFEKSQFDFEAFVDDAEFKKFLDKGQIIINNSPWMSFKGETSLTYTEKHLDFHKDQKACTTALKVLAITPTEKLIACCGLPLEEIPELCLGDLTKKSIKEIIQSQNDDFIKIWIHVEGPDAVIDYARQFDSTIPKQHEKAHVCDKCRAMYHDKRVIEIVKKSPPKHMDRIINKYLQSLMFIKTEAAIECDVEFYKASCSLKSAREIRKLALTA
ncbi:MAG: radical SAM protein [Verrucomicrobiae bacterium]|nr:radical SAM protein [Verrucomicrobiae bacterium]